MLPDRVSNPGPLTYESGSLPTALRGPASHCKKIKLIKNKSCYTEIVSIQLKTRKCVYETLCPQPYACPEKRFKSERSATQTIKKLISSSTP